LISTCNYYSLQKIANNINEIIHQLCNCSATAQLVEYSNCPSAELLILEGTLIYSDEGGNMTATTVLNILQNWLQSTNSASITIDGSVLELSHLYLTKKKRLTMSNYCPDQASSVSSKEVVSAMFLCDSLFLQGVVAGMLLSALVLSVLGYVASY
jgi:hypothetical protein